MEFTDRTKILLVIALIVVGLYLFNNNNKKNTSEGYSRERFEPMTEDDTDNFNNYEPDFVDDSEESVLLRKMTTKNSARNGYKKSNYRDGERGGVPSLDRFFKEGDQFDGNDNDQYVASDMNEGSFASYQSGNGRKMSEEEKFNSTNFLPKERNDDWFEDVHATSVKNRHLINIYRPVGVNTVVSSGSRNRDIRGSPNNPKTVVSPFLNSSIEPSHDIIGFCN